MGNETLMREESRGVWLWPSLEAAWQDATYTLRDLRRKPIFTIGVTLTLATWDRRERGDVLARRSPAVSSAARA